MVICLRAHLRFAMKWIYSQKRAADTTAPETAESAFCKMSLPNILTDMKGWSL